MPKEIDAVFPTRAPGPSSGPARGNGSESMEWFSPVLDNHMNRAHRRLVFEEVVQRTAAQQQQRNDRPQVPLKQPEQQMVPILQQELHAPQQQHQHQPLEEEKVDQQQQEEEERERQLERFARNVRLQLRESRRFSAGAPSSVLVPPAQIYRADESLSAFQRRRIFMSRGADICTFVWTVPCTRYSTKAKGA
uniref:Uncharacterized protein n=1 Tax=Globodera rostochiensis TaxID=31243 RepID=A0A914HR36_GLORO